MTTFESPRHAKLEQQIDDRAAPELVSATVNSTAKIVREAASANNDLGTTISVPGDVFKFTGTVSSPESR